MLPNRPCTVWSLMPLSIFQVLESCQLHMLNNHLLWTLKLLLVYTSLAMRVQSSQKWKSWQHTFSKLLKLVFSAMASTQVSRQRVQRSRPSASETDFSMFEETTDSVGAAKLHRAEELAKERDMMGEREINAWDRHNSYSTYTNCGWSKQKHCKNFSFRMRFSSLLSISQISSN